MKTVKQVTSKYNMKIINLNYPFERKASALLGFSSTAFVASATASGNIANFVNIEIYVYKIHVAMQRKRISRT